MDRDEVEVHKNGKKERGWYPTTMTEQASSITVLLQSKEISLYRESSMIVLFQEPGKKATRFVAQQNLESPSCFFFVCFADVSDVSYRIYADVSENWLPFERLSINNYGGTDS